MMIAHNILIVKIDIGYYCSWHRRLKTDSQLDSHLKYHEDQSWL